MNGIALGLERITTLLSKLAHPESIIPIIHLTGTNGKGSTSAYILSILLESGLRVGSFNSPFLIRESDCIKLNGIELDDNLFKVTKQSIINVDEQHKIGATSFEILTATAFKILSSQEPPLDLAIIEVGVGGLTDSTNVVGPGKTLLSIITSIELDHQKFLGDTVEEIATIKGGIIKDGTDVVIADQGHSEVTKIIEKISKEKNCNLTYAGAGIIESTTFGKKIPIPKVNYRLSPTSTILSKLPLPGSYQLSNSATAVAAIQLLRTSARITNLVPSLSTITDSQIISGLENTQWRGRLDWTSLPNLPNNRFLIDGAHNPSSANLLADYLHSLSDEIFPTTLITSITSPRSPIDIFKPILKAHSVSSKKRINKVIVLPFSLPETMGWIQPTPNAELLTAIRSINPELEVIEVENFDEALSKLGKETVLVAGSLYLAADYYRVLERS